MAMGKEGQQGAGEVFIRWQLQDEAPRVLKIWGRGGAPLDSYSAGMAALWVSVLWCQLSDCGRVVLTACRSEFLEYTFHKLLNHNPSTMNLTPSDLKLLIITYSSPSEWDTHLHQRSFPLSNNKQRPS